MKGCGTCKLASANLRGGRPKKGTSHAGRPKTVKTFEDVMELDPSKPIPPSMNKAICHVISIKMKQSTLLTNSVQLSSGGPAIHVSPSASGTKRNPDSFEKDNIQSNKAKYCNQTKQSTDIIKLIADDSPDAFAAQTAAVAKSVE